MAGALGWIKKGDGFRRQFFGGDGLELLLDVWRLFCRCDVIFHFFAQRRIGIGGQPHPAQGILDHVFHDPFGGEKLGGGRNVFAFNHLADDFVFLFGDIKLI